MDCLEVLIAAYGNEGIERIVRADHPRMEGVQYTVTWQMPDGEAIVPEVLSRRSDFRVIVSRSRGLSVNRNLGLRESRGDILLIADDDVFYDPAGLHSVIEAFANHPECDFLTFRFSTDGKVKNYSSREFDWARPERGSFVSSIEMAFRREKVAWKQFFNESFGVGSEFCCGEEQLFVAEMLHRGLRGRYIPATVCHHPGDTTAVRADTKELIAAKGATFLYLHPHTWPLRMVIHGVRYRRVWWYCRQWLAGVKRALKNPAILRAYRCAEK